MWLPDQLDIGCTFPFSYGLITSTLTLYFHWAPLCAHAVTVTAEYHAIFHTEIMDHPPEQSRCIDFSKESWDW